MRAPHVVPSMGQLENVESGNGNKKREMVVTLKYFILIKIWKWSSVNRELARDSCVALCKFYVQLTICTPMVVHLYPVQLQDWLWAL